MSDNTVNKVFEVTTSNVALNLTEKIAAAKERAATQVTREKYYLELQQQIAGAFNDIIARGRQQAAVDREFYEKELVALSDRLRALLTSIRDDAQKSVAAMSAYSEALEKINEMPDFFSRELAKAKELQEKAAAGELDKPRKPGTRPDRLKDIRNYVESEKDK
jgi:hypothetical protein